MTQRDDAKRLSRAADQIIGTWYCLTGKHWVSNDKPHVMRSGRRMCAHCRDRIASLRKQQAKTSRRNP